MGKKWFIVFKLEQGRAVVSSKRAFTSYKKGHYASEEIRKSHSNENLSNRLQTLHLILIHVYKNNLSCVQSLTDSSIDQNEVKRLSAWM